MSPDERIRMLEREVALGDQDAMDRLKREWLRTQAWYRCPSCGAEVPSDARAEHGESCSAAPGSGVRVVSVPASGPVAMRPRKMPLFDHAFLQPGERDVEFFTTFQGKPLWRCNIPSGGLPEHSVFFLYGISLIPDAESDARDVLKVWDRSVLSFEFSPITLSSWPARVSMSDQPKIVDQEGEEDELDRSWKAREVMPEPARVVRLRNDGPVRDVTISKKPIQLRYEDRFRFVLRSDPISERSSPVGIMLVMFGLLMLPVTG